MQPIISIKLLTYAALKPVFAFENLEAFPNALIQEAIWIFDILVDDVNYCEKAE